jgi:hypothetical protein
MSEQPNEPAFEVLTPQEVADLKDAWMNGRGLTKLPPVGNLILRMIATVERAREAFGLANRKWDECRVTIDQLESKLSNLHFMYDGAKIDIEKLEAKLKAAEELCEAVEGGRNANSRKELRAWEQDIEDALKAWQVMREKK